MIWEAIRTGLYGALVVWSFIVAMALPVAVVVAIASDKRSARDSSTYNDLVDRVVDEGIDNPERREEIRRMLKEGR